MFQKGNWNLETWKKWLVTSLFSQGTLTVCYCPWDWCRNRADCSPVFLERLHWGGHSQHLCAVETDRWQWTGHYFVDPCAWQMMDQCSAYEWHRNLIINCCLFWIWCKFFSNQLLEFWTFVFFFIFSTNFSPVIKFFRCFYVFLHFFLFFSSFFYFFYFFCIFPYFSSFSSIYFEFFLISLHFSLLFLPFYTNFWIYSSFHSNFTLE